jgi:hypothetical protein
MSLVLPTQLIKDKVAALNVQDCLKHLAVNHITRVLTPNDVECLIKAGATEIRTHSERFSSKNQARIREQRTNEYS